MMKKIFIIVFTSFLANGLFAHVGIIYPAGNESYIPGEEVNIQWKILIPHNTINWDLYFSIDDGNSWVTIKLDIPLTTLTYKWTVPDVSTTKAKIKIVQDNSDLDYEGLSNIFKISGTTGLTEQPEYIVNLPFPNPFSYYTTLNYRNPERVHHSLHIYNEKGQLVKILTNGISDQFVVYRENLAYGSYYFQLFADNKRKVATGKLIVR
jgi:hypothetical protein